VRRTGAALVGLALVLGAACSDDGGDDDDIALEDVPGGESTTTTAEPTTTTSAPDPTTTTATTAPEESDGPAIPDNPDDYATLLIRAWEQGDAATAQVLATDVAFDTLFAFESGGPEAGWQLVACDGAAGSSFCTFSAGGDPRVIVRVTNETASQSGPDAVTEVRVEG
jgi:hypothetical protein